MIEDKEWEEFYRDSKAKWKDWAPDKTSIELYLSWKQSKINNTNWQWRKEIVHDQGRL